MTHIIIPKKAIIPQEIRVAAQPALVAISAIPYEDAALPTYTEALHIPPTVAVFPMRSNLRGKKLISIVFTPWAQPITRADSTSVTAGDFV